VILLKVSIQLVHVKKNFVANNGFNLFSASVDDIQDIGIAAYFDHST